MLIIATIAALGMGFVLGMLGGGGSILAVPILVYLAGLDPKDAIATSLLVVGATAAVAAVGHARAGNVDWRTGAIFGAFAMVGAFGGGSLAQFIPGSVLLVLFGVLMLVTAVAMLRGRGQVEAHRRTGADLPIAKVAVEGIAVGAVTGLVGAGGGFIVVPALVIFGGLSMRRAIGTSLVVIAMKSLAGFAGYASHLTIDVGLTVAFVAAAVLGSFAGARASSRVNEDLLRRGFAVFVVAMGLFIVVSEVGVGLWILWFVGAGLTLVGVRAAVRLAAARRLGRRATPCRDVPGVARQKVGG